jgi:presenilin-like A22 family membrane protease
MKHSLKITALLIIMFFIAQMIGIAVMISNNEYQKLNQKEPLPDFIAPPKDMKPEVSLGTIIIAIALGVFLMLALMKFKAEIVLRIWFFLVVILAIAIALNSFFVWFVPMPFLIALLIALPLAVLKIFVRNIKIHNLTELLIYPGVASLFAPILNVWAMAVLLVLISIYDIYAVWHAGFMQKMAKYQIKQLRIFTGFFIPYLSSGQKLKLKDKAAKAKEKKIKVSVAILGGGDIVFPIILAGVILAQFGLAAAIIISLGATLALAALFYYSQKGKFYPAMPFISAGCFVALGIVYLLSYLNLLS